MIEMPATMLQKKIIHITANRMRENANFGRGRTDS